MGVHRTKTEADVCFLSAEVQRQLANQSCPGSGVRYSATAIRGQRVEHWGDPEEPTTVPLKKELACQYLSHQRSLTGRLRLLFHSNLLSLSF